MAVEYLGQGNDDGTVVGRSATDKVGFYGKTPVVQPSGSAQAAVSTDILTLTGSYNSTIIIAAVTAVLGEVNAIRAALVAQGLIKGSA